MAIKKSVPANPTKTSTAVMVSKFENKMHVPARKSSSANKAPTTSIKKGQSIKIKSQNQKNLGGFLSDSNVYSNNKGKDEPVIVQKKLEEPAKKKISVPAGFKGASCDQQSNFDDDGWLRPPSNVHQRRNSAPTLFSGSDDNRPMDPMFLDPLSLRGSRNEMNRRDVLMLPSFQQFLNREDDESDTVNDKGDKVMDVDGNESPETALLPPRQQARRESILRYLMVKNCPKPSMFPSSSSKRAVMRRGSAAVVDGTLADFYPSLASSAPLLALPNQLSAYLNNFLAARSTSVEEAALLPISVNSLTENQLSAPSMVPTSRTKKVTKTVVDRSPSLLFTSGKGLYLGRYAVTLEELEELYQVTKQFFVQQASSQQQREASSRSSC
jgi:hypothetical protein